MDGAPVDTSHGAEARPAFDASVDWYLLRLRPGGLARARENLARQGYDSYCPMHTRTVRRAGQLRTQQRPLFPSYLFLCAKDRAPNWRSVNATYGVANAVCLEPGRPARLPPGLVPALLENEAAGNVTGTQFAAGQPVRVLSGPFADFLAQVEATPEKDRVLVLLQMMGRRVRTELRPSQLVGI